MVDVRVIRDEFMAMDTWQLDQYLVCVDFHPPAAGPEVELTFDGVSEERAVELVSQSGLTVLSSREREPARG